MLGCGRSCAIGRVSKIPGTPVVHAVDRGWTAVLRGGGDGGQLWRGGAQRIRAREAGPPPVRGEEGAHLVLLGAHARVAVAEQAADELAVGEVAGRQLVH